MLLLPIVTIVSIVAPSFVLTKLILSDPNHRIELGDRKKNYNGDHSDYSPQVDQELKLDV